MTNALKLLVGFALIFPGTGLLLRALRLAPPALEAITSFFVGGGRPGIWLPTVMVVFGGLLVTSALFDLFDRPEAERRD